jgi:P-type conjugative transfer protein TrbJ
MSHPFRAALAATAAALSLARVSPADAQVTVFDPRAYVQDVLTATRALQQINNQIRGLENQANMLINQAKNLAGLPFSAVAQLEATFQQTEQLLIQAQRIAYSVASIDQAFTQAYPQSYAGATPAAQLSGDARTRWLNAMAGFQDALHVQAGVVQNLPASHAQIAALVGASQAAPGALSAVQAGNQLTALQTQQLADLTAVMASIARAQSLDGARAVEGQAQAQAQMAAFLNYGAGYSPSAVAMFH